MQPDSLRLTAFDHLVLTAANAEATFAFYCGVLGMEKRAHGEGRFALHFGQSKINVHVAPARIEPRAAAAAPGTADVCITSVLAPGELASALASRGAVVELGPVERNGARGAMTSFYLRDPDGNLVEIATYRRDAAGDTPRQVPVRRQNRAEEDPAWIDDFLSRSPAAVIALPGGDWPLLNPNLFLYDRDTRTVWFHTAAQGATRAAIEASGIATVCVFAMGRLLPGAVVTDYSVEYASVVLRGTVSILRDPAAVRRVFDMQMAKYFPAHRAGIEYQTFTDEEAARATVYEMKVLEWSAKKHVSEPDHPGARLYAGAGVQPCP